MNPMEKLARLTCGWEIYFAAARHTVEINSNFPKVAKINQQRDLNFDQATITFEYSKNFAGYILAKVRRSSPLDIDKLVNELESSRLQSLNSD